MLPPQTGNRVSRAQKVFQRAYIACQACRETKSKCKVSDDLSVCEKCKRQNRQCVFATRRSARQRGTKQPSAQADSYRHNASARDDPEQTISVNSSTSNPTPESHIQSIPTTQTSDERVDPHPNNVQTGLEEELTRTIVSSSRDAVHLLFKAAVQQDANEPPSQQGLEHTLNIQQTSSLENSSTSGVIGATPSQDVLNLWSRSLFVRLGRLSAQECVTYIDLFFLNLSNLSLVTNIYFSRHENHRTLIFEEHLLCSTLLMISSRYHPLADSGTGSRSHFVHDCLWRHVQQLIQKLTFGYEMFPSPTSRTLGCVEALLLLTEWHPRALVFPQMSDCNDGYQYYVVDDSATNERQDSATSRGSRWREELFEPAKRADRISWMMLGIASSLAHELGVYDESDMTSTDPKHSVAKQRLRRLLYLNTNQLSFTLGCTSSIPPTVSESASAPSNIVTDDPLGEGEMLISLWIDLTSLLKEAKSLSFSSPANIRLGASYGLLDHLKPLLNQWYYRLQNFKPTKATRAAFDLLSIDYQYARMYITSMAIQQLVKGIDCHQKSKTTVYELLSLGNQSDLMLIMEVVDASMLILSKTVVLSSTGVLRFCPARVFFRIISACVFLLKSLAFGALHQELSEALNLLDQCIDALACLASDTDQLWGKYAILIKRYAQRFRSKAQASTLRTSKDLPGSDVERPIVSIEEDTLFTTTLNELQGLDDVWTILNPSGVAIDDWLVQPDDL